MRAWLDNDDGNPEPWDLESPHNRMVDQERSYSLWQLCQSTEWAKLPEAGGWLDQDDAFLHDAMVISRRLAYLRKGKKQDDKRKDAAAKAMGLGSVLNRFRK